MIMKTGTIITIAILLVVIFAVPTMAGSGPKIVIDDTDNKVMFHKFNESDDWSITLRNASTGELAYQFSGTTGKMDSGNNNNWMVWFNCVSPGALKHGILRNIVPGKYSVSASGTTGGTHVSASAKITVLASDGGANSPCGNPIPPVPELNPVMLVPAGLAGLLLVLKKFGGH